MAIGRKRLLAGVRGALFAMVAAAAGAAWAVQGPPTGLIVLITAYGALHVCLLREITDEDLLSCRVGGCMVLLDTAFVAGALALLPDYRWNLLWAVFLYGLLASGLGCPLLGLAASALMAGLYAALCAVGQTAWREPDATWWGLGAGTLAMVVLYASGIAGHHGRHHKAVAEAGEPWHRLFDGLPTPMVVVDGAGRVLDANQAFRALGRFDGGDLKGRSLFEMLHGIWFPDGQSVAPEWLDGAPEGAIRLVIPWLKGEFEVTKEPCLGSSDFDGGSIWMFRRRSA